MPHEAVYLAIVAHSVYHKRIFFYSEVQKRNIICAFWMVCGPWFHCLTNMVDLIFNVHMSNVNMIVSEEKRLFIYINIHVYIYIYICVCVWLSHEDSCACSYWKCKRCVGQTPSGFKYIYRVVLGTNAIHHLSRMGIYHNDREFFGNERRVFFPFKSICQLPITNMHTLCYIKYIGNLILRSSELLINYEY